jgi:DNA-binding winged helix-turn-helix (wHTH) protein
MRGDQPTALGPRAAALLRQLVERAGQHVGKDALIEAAWPGLVVEESNLTVQIAALRKVLSDDSSWIETSPRRGYRYVGPPVSVELSTQGGDASPKPGTSARSTS